jgi:Uma2 family endonuclease
MAIFASAIALRFAHLYKPLLFLSLLRHVGKKAIIYSMATKTLSQPVGKGRRQNLPQYPIFRLSVTQYHKMIESGILTENDPIELLEGWLVTKMPQNPAHLFSTQVLQDILKEVLPDGWFLNIQGPVVLEDSEPEPDAVVVYGDRRDYLKEKPGPQNIALIIEVSDSTLQLDRSVKKRLFASAAIPVYWIVNLVDRQLEIYRYPSARTAMPDYQQQQILKPDEQAAVIIDDQEVAYIQLRDLFP